MYASASMGFFYSNKILLCLDFLFNTLKVWVGEEKTNTTERKFSPLADLTTSREILLNILIKINSIKLTSLSNTIIL